MKSKTLGWIMLIIISFVIGYFSGFTLLDCLFKMFFILGGLFFMYQSVNLIEGGKFGDLRESDKDLIYWR